MARPTVRRRSRDGLVEIVPTNVEPTRSERHAVMFGVILLTKGLYLSTLIPPPQLLIVLVCCVLTELGITLRDSGLLQAPKAPVFALETGRRHERRGPP